MTRSDLTRSLLVECYWPGVNEALLLEAARRTRQASLELDVEFLGAILVPEDETVFGLFEGREPEIRAASTRGGLPFERVLESLWIGDVAETRRQKGD
jgi:hypothetical protein